MSNKRPGRRQREQKLAILWVADKAAARDLPGIANTSGLHDYYMPNMDEVAEEARELYNNHLRGGEGHMEVGKLVMNVKHKKSTMTLSVKPFGCMPSSGVSDGVQSYVTEKWPARSSCRLRLRATAPSTCTAACR
jgi:predicted nucleotide-binding protein (sugar kinase/HSP70/actin superfamily)